MFCKTTKTFGIISSCAGLIETCQAYTMSYVSAAKYKNTSDYFIKLNILLIVSKNLHKPTAVFLTVIFLLKQFSVEK